MPTELLRGTARRNVFLSFVPWPNDRLFTPRRAGYTSKLAIQRAAGVDRMPSSYREITVVDSSPTEPPTVDEMLAEAQNVGADSDAWLSRFARALVPSLVGEDWRALFAPDLDRATRRRVALGILRLVAVADSAFDIVEFRVRSLALADEVLPDIYRVMGVKPGDQGFEKQRELCKYASRVEEELRSAAALPASAAGLAGVRQRLMSTLNSALAKPLISAFTSREFVSQIDAALAAAEVYAKSSSHEEVPLAVADVRSACAALERHSPRGTYERIVADASRQIAALVESAFAASPVSQPGNVVIQLTEKKYPLHSGGDIEVTLEVRNTGPGVAIDTYVAVQDEAGLHFEEPETFVGTIPVGVVLVSLRATVDATAGDCLLLATARWRDTNQAERSTDAILELQRQRADIDWSALSTRDLYSLEPVESDRHLIGRSDVLRTLTAMAEAGAVGNAYIFGQRRVGKTSIAKTLLNRISTTQDEHLHVPLYIEAGDYVTPNEADTVAALGGLICEEIRRAHPKFRAVEVPSFTDALSPISRFLRAVTDVDPDARFIVVLDEFDTLPPKLFRRTEVGDAFFQTLRSIAGKSNVGLVLVGGENMQTIVAGHDDMVNKFREQRVDYFDRSTEWADYCELVRRPASDWLEISDDAVVAIFEAANGNPYFSNLICGQLANLQARRHDSHATRSEVREAVRLTVAAAGGNSFAHFWRDGILGTGPEAEELSIARRKVLVALAECLREGSATTDDAISRVAKTMGISSDETLQHLQQFCARHVLELRGDAYHCRVPLFEEWLREKGRAEIVTSDPNLEKYLAALRGDDALYVQADEIVRLVEGWSLFKGQEVGPERVRAWLSQFQSPADQRLMFRLISKLTFYSGSGIRAMLYEAHHRIARDLTAGVARDRYGRGRMSRSDIVLSHVDGVGKSGAHYARLYASENGVYVDNILPRERLVEELRTRTKVEAVVFVDDFIGTGDSSSENLSHLAETLERSDTSPLRWFFVALCGTDRGIANLALTAHRCELPLEILVCDQDAVVEGALTSADVFPDEADRAAAREIAYEKGAALVPRDPLGYGDMESLVVFDSSIPNNCLPILWHSGGDWIPLFRRM